MSKMNGVTSAFVDSVAQRANALLEGREEGLLSEVDVGNIALFIFGEACPSSRSALSKLVSFFSGSEEVSSLIHAGVFASKLSDEVRPLLVVHSDVGGALCNDLMLFRKNNLNFSVILASADFARHDLSLERGAICDASLRLPYSFVSLAMAVQAALNNSSEMRQRSMYHWATE